MKKPGPNRIAELRQAHGWNQRELADALGVHYMTVSKLERGEMRLTQPWMESIAESLGIDPFELIQNTMQSRMVIMNGFIENKSSVDSISGLFENGKIHPPKKVLEFNFETRIDELHLTIRTEQFSPAIRYGDIARFTRFEEDAPHPEFWIGRICLFVFDGDKTVLIGVPERGSERGSYDLRCPVSRVQSNLRPDRIYVLTMVLSSSLPG